MKIAIHDGKGFNREWIKYCKTEQIDYKLVDCYSNSIVYDLKDCDALMWHFHQSNPKDFIFAKQLLYSVQASGKIVFPDYNTCWHFDDKIGQKYLLEAIGAPIVTSYVFYDKALAIRWARKSSFPKVFKLRGGASSDNVMLVSSEKQALRLIKRAFGTGFRRYNARLMLKERWRRYKIGKTDLYDLIKGIGRLIKKTNFEKIAGKDKGYVYFQDFLPNNYYDIRVIVIDGKAFAIKRLVRKGDFRASGSGEIEYGRGLISNKTLEISFQIAELLKSNCLAIDYIYENGNPFITEISYGFVSHGYDKCEGYWDKHLDWYEGEFNPCGWMVNGIVEKIRPKK